MLLHEIRSAAGSLLLLLLALAALVARAEDCDVSGIVTMVSAWSTNSFVLVADDGERYYVTGPRPSHCAPGDYVRVVGVRNNAFFQGGISARNCSVLHSGELPPAPMASFRDIRFADCDLGYISFSGVFRGFVRHASSHGSVLLRFGAPDGTVLVRTRDDGRDWQALMDADMVVEGTVIPAFTRQGRRLGEELVVNDPSDIRLLAPPPGETADEGRFTPHARRVRGVVTYVEPGEYCIVQKDAEVSWMRIEELDDVPNAGDEVEFLGFAKSREERREFLPWKVSRLRSGVGLPPPIGLRGLDLFSLAEELQDDVDAISGKRITIGGRLMAVGSVGTNRWEMQLAVNGGMAQVVMTRPPPDEVLDVRQFSPRIVVTGIARLAFARGDIALPVPRVASLTVLSAPDDEVAFEMTDDVAWSLFERRMRSLGLGLAALVLLVLAAFLVRERSRRRKVAVVLAERRRLGKDIHDTIEQNLAVAHMLLSSSLSGETVGPHAAQAVANASELLIRTKREIRGIVWDLQGTDLSLKRPVDVLREFADGMMRTGTVTVRTHFRGIPERMGGECLSDVFFIVREAVWNAIRHGKATCVLMLADPIGGKGFVLRILSNGKTFDFDSAPGPSTGHFGLSSMRDRAARSHLRLGWEVSDGWCGIRLEIAK